jgi:glycosyltransferase involved in cell wall biosynthesis
VTAGATGREVAHRLAGRHGTKSAQIGADPEAARYPLRDNERMRDIVISNGFGKFPLAHAAAEIDRAGRLAVMFTAAYPGRLSGALRRLVPGSVGRRIGRLERRRTDVAPNRVVSLAVSDAVYQLGRVSTAVVGETAAHEHLDAFAMRLYGAAAGRALRRKRLNAGVYHFRAGFGHSSVSVARRLGMINLVNHSQAHPLYFEYLQQNEGRFPGDDERPVVGLMWSSIWRDIDRADVVLVNSRFVLESCLRAGLERSRLHLVYEGVDDEFLGYLSPRPPPRASRITQFLFAGYFSNWKGADVLLRALQLTREAFAIRVAGHIEPELRAAFPELLTDERLTFLGYLERPQLAREYESADALILPSLSEGWARVTREAMFAGCALIATPNSADVEDGIHGRVVPPGDAEALARAIDWATEHLLELRAMGSENRAFATSALTQQAYGQNLIHVYDEILGMGRRVQ